MKVIGHFFEQDMDGRLTKYRDYDDDPNGTRKMLQYTYDAAGRAVTMKDYENYDTLYSYTALGQISTITAPGSKVWVYDYNALGQPTKCMLPNGMATEYSYDGANRMTKLEHKDGATVKLGFTYGLTPGGQITRITHNDSTYWSYGNDGRGRLTKAERYTAGNALQLKETYSYDAGDNLLTKVQYDQRPSPAVTKNTWYRYNAGNELTKMTAGGVDTNMTYGDWGRMITKAQGAYTAAYLWRYGGKLKGVTTNFPGETTTAYLVDALGKRRVRIVQPDPNNSATWVVTAYRWDAGWNVIGEYDPGTDSSTHYDLGARNKTLAHRGMATLAEIDGANPTSGTTRYYAHDHLGSARALYSSAKAELGTLEYNPYGDTYASSGTQPAYSFTGKPYDASIGMYYFPYRYYSPEMDRWISRDPLGMVDGPNLYGYLRGSALASIDKLGREACTLAICGTIWGTCAIADGPLPIGDIIGGSIFAGGMIWAATRPDEWTETVGMPERLPPFVPDPMTSCISGCKIAYAGRPIMRLACMAACWLRVI